MKKIVVCLLALLLLTGCAAQEIAKESAVEVPAEQTMEEVAGQSTEETAEEATEEPVFLGNFSAQTLDGEELDQSWFSHADLTILNVWATYCGPCKQEMPVLGALDQEMGNVQVLGIVTDVLDQNGDPDSEQIELAQELLAAYSCAYPNLILNASLAELGFASLQAVPATLFVDSEGYLVGLGFYGALDEAGWRAVIEERLEMVKQ